MVAAYLLFRHGLTPDQALEWIRLQRPIAWPNRGFREQLGDFYSVLQMDHPGDFGWRGLSMCVGLPAVDAQKEEAKRMRREEVEGVRKKWRVEGVEWGKCQFVGRDEEIEKFLQRVFNGLV